MEAVILLISNVFDNATNLCYIIKVMTKKNIKFKTWPIIGHKKIIYALQNNIKNNFINHAYLFVGPESVGKKEVAINFAKCLMCENDVRPCLKCRTCKAVSSNKYSDFIFIDNKEGKIKIEEVRKLQHQISLKAYSNYKFCLINGIESFTTEAANAILKLLEEPKGTVVFVLIAKSLENILPTIISRCAIFRFSLVSEGDILNWLNKMADSTTEINNIIKIARGKPGLVLKMVRDDDILRDILDAENDIKVLFENNFNRSFTSIAGWANFENYKVNKLDILMQWLRDLYLYKIGNFDQIELISNIDNYYKIYAEKLSFAKIKNIIENVVKARELIGHNANKKLVLENIALSIKDE